MTNRMSDQARKDLVIGRVLSKASGTLTHNGVVQLFTITGGEVLITHLWLVVTTAMTGANTVAIQQDPTTGDTTTIVTATDLGTADTLAGSTVGLTRGTTAASAFLRGGTSELNVPATIGEIELLATGSGTVDGAVTVYAAWVPLTDGALMVAAA
jgi:hypothetical protein